MPKSERIDNINNNSEINETKNNATEAMQICCVKNCQNPIKKGEGIKVGNDLFCPKCGAILMKNILGL
ncbi:MAG: hypothetical protein ACTSRZ_19235 [Promethearchaeota archaeon]